MKVFEILEGLNRVPKREIDNPHPSHVDDPDDAWIHGDDPITAHAVIRSILGSTAKFGYEDDYDKNGPNDIHIGQSTRDGSFASADEPPGGGGSINIRDADGTSPIDIAVAAHEAFHAKLQQNKKNFSNEHVVNRLAIRWLQDHLSGMFLHAAVEHLMKSKRSYSHKKYDSSRKFKTNWKRQTTDEIVADEKKEKEEDAAQKRAMIKRNQFPLNYTRK